jgi:hypothetical protein
MGLCYYITICQSTILHDQLKIEVDAIHQSTDDQHQDHFLDNLQQLSKLNFLYPKLQIHVLPAC